MIGFKGETPFTYFRVDSYANAGHYAFSLEFSLGASGAKKFTPDFVLDLLESDCVPDL